MLAHGLTGTTLDARMSLSYVTYLHGDTDTAVEYLEQYLQQKVGHQKLRIGKCEGCGQVRGDDITILTCDKCKVGRFCSKYHHDDI